MSAKLKRLFVFDIDGTLVDSTKPHQTAFLNTVKRIVGEPKNTDWGSYRDHTDSGIFRDILAEYDGTTIDSKKLSYFDNTLESFFLKIIDEKPLVEILGAKRFLNSIIERGEFYCFATGSMRAAAIHKLKVVQPKIRTDLLSTASEAQTREEIVAAAIKKAESVFEEGSFDQIISIGDGIWDFKTAQNLKLDFLGIGKRLEGTLPEGVPLFPDFSEAHSSLLNNIC